jgi:hypothetical protein
MKKNIPLIILESIQPIIDDNLGLIKPIKDTGAMFHLIDTDETSDFYFKVTKQDVQNSKLKYLTEYKPKGRQDVRSNATWLDLNEVVKYLKNWLGQLEGYNKIHTIYDDPILKNYQEKFEKLFDILDADADFTTFDLPQQLYLEEYLSNVQSKISTLKEGRSENDIQELTDIENEAREIKKHLTKETKRKIINRLSHLWAKAQKEGLEIIKEIFVSVSAELTKRLLTGG